MKKILSFLVLWCCNIGFSQYEMIDQKMTAMPKSLEKTTTDIAGYIAQNVASDEDKIRAAFYWIADNISYDVANMYNQKVQTPQQRITDVLKSRKGVCMHYAELFNEIANKMNIKTYVIDGYTKQFGKVARLAHSWNASKINGKWYLIDVTWGAGYVNGDAYYKKINNSYFKSDWAEFLKTHMPYDYMWQLNEKPITNDDFYKDIIESDAISTHYDFVAEIAQFEQLPELDKIQKRIERLQQTGLKNHFLTERLNQLKLDYEGLKNNNSIPKLERIVADFNEANRQLNEFIHYRNSRFTPMLSDEEIRKKVQAPYDKLMFCQEELNKIVDVSKENLANFNSLKKTIAEAKKRFDVQRNFVIDYLAKSPSERASAFMIKRK